MRRFIHLGHSRTLSDHAVPRGKNSAPAFAAAWIVLAGAVAFSLAGCDQPSTPAPGDTTSEAPAEKTSEAPGEKTSEVPDDAVTAEVVSIKPMTGDKVRLTLKVTNASTREIRRAKALVTVQDADGNALGTDSTYLIHGQKGGLAPGASVEEDVIVPVSDTTKAVGMTFKMEDVRFGK